MQSVPFLALFDLSSQRGSASGEGENDCRVISVALCQCAKEVTEHKDVRSG